MSLEPKNTKLLFPVFCLVTAILGIESGGFQLALLRAVNEFEFDTSMIGLPVAAQFISMSFIPLIFGPLSDKIGKLKILTLFIGIFAFACYFVWASNTAIEFLIGVFIIGAGFSVIECSIAATISDVFSEKAEKYINLSQCFFGIGAVASPIILQALITNYSVSWQLMFLISAIMMVAIIPVILTIRINPVKGKKEGHIQDTTEKIRPILLIGFILCMFAYVGVEGSLAFFADTLFTINMNTPALGALAISFFWGFMGIGRFFIGRLKTIPRNATAFSFLGMAVVVFIIIFISDGYVLLVVFAIAGIACACVWPGIIHSAVSLNRNSSGTILSYLNVGSGLGGAVVPLLIGALWNSAGFSFSFIIMALLPIAAGFFMLKNSKKTSNI